MIPFFGAILALASISTAGISAYYALIKPRMESGLKDSALKLIYEERDKIVKSWINCGLFPGINGSGIYTARTSLLKELDIFNMDTSINIIKFTDGISPAVIEQRIHNVGLENVKEITIKHLGNTRLICKNITIYYVKDRIRLISKVVQKKRVTIVSDKKHTEQEVIRDVLVLDFNDYISIIEPEMEQYQIHHISFDLQSEKTVPIMINIIMKNKAYMLMTCSFKNVLTMSFIDDMQLSNGCVKTNGVVSALIEENDLSFTEPLPLQFRPIKTLVIEDTIPTHLGFNNITSIAITNNGTDDINITEIGVFYYDVASRYIKYKNLTINQGSISSNNTILTESTAGLEILEIKIIAYTSVSVRVFIDLNTDTTHRRIETCIFNNVINITLFREPSVDDKPFATPTSTVLPITTHCKNPFTMNGYLKIYEYEMRGQNPTSVTFTQPDIIDIEGNIPELYGINIVLLELYATEDITFHGFTLYYVNPASNGMIKKISRPHIYGGAPIFDPVLITKDTVCSSIVNVANAHIYRIKFKVTSAKFARFFLKMISQNSEYTIVSCIGNNTFYIDLIGETPINIKATCSRTMPMQIYSTIKLETSKFYTDLDPATTKVITWQPLPTWDKTGGDLVGVVPGNIRNPVTGLYIVTIKSDISTLINTSVGIYYKYPTERVIKYKKLTRYLTEPGSNILNSKLSDTEDIVIDNTKILLCMDDALGLYDIYEIVVEMNNLDWAQVHIGLHNQSGQEYKNVICMRNNRINIPVFGKTPYNTIIRNLLNCLVVKPGYASADIKVADMIYDTDPYYENCLPLPLIYKDIGNAILPTTTSNLGIQDVIDIGFVNVGNVRIEISSITISYTHIDQIIKTIQLTNLKDDKARDISFPLNLIPETQYVIGVKLSEDYINYKIQRIYIVTTHTIPSQMLIAINKYMKVAGAYQRNSNGFISSKTLLLATCIVDNFMSINFVDN